MYDRKCQSCGLIKENCWEPMTFETPECGGCGSKENPRVLLTGRPSNVIGDDIPGGVLIYNAICHPDGTPKRYYSKSEIARAAKEGGWVPTGNKHVPMPGSDKGYNGSRKWS